MTGRMKFIPALRTMIVNSIPAADTFVEETIDKWEAGEEADTPIERAVFAVCDHHAEAIRDQADQEGDS